MAFAERPYFRSTLSELRGLFLSNLDDSSVLSAVASELEHRDRPAATILRRQVLTRIDELKTRGLGPAIHAAPPKQPLSRNVREPSLDAEPVKTNARREKAHSSKTEDAHLRRPSELKRIEPLGVGGRPPKYVKALKTDIELKISADAPRPHRYATTLGVLIADMRRERKGARHILLENGERISLDHGHIGYSFAFTEDAELFEDARIELRIDNHQLDGQIVSISGGHIIIAVEEDLGETVARCVLTIDNTALLEALKDRLEKAGGEGRALNSDLAEKVITNSGQAKTAEISPTSVAFERLNTRQKDAVRLALANDVVYLWGPPGTGKTSTLSVVIQELFEQGKRILICSNTNRAVDQVLFNLCRTLGTAHEAMESGRILRLGRIAHDQLKQDYSEYVTLDGIVERRSRDLMNRKAGLESKLADVARRAASTEAKLRLFGELDNLVLAIKESAQEVARLTNEGGRLVQSISSAKSRLATLTSELEKFRDAGRIKRAFMRAESAIGRDIETVNKEIEDLTASGVQFPNLFKRAKELEADLAARRDALIQSLGTVARSDLLKDMERFRAERQPLLDELSAINKTLADIEESVMRDATIIGATVTKAYLSATNLPVFDTVIIDEASMVLLPAVYYAVGLGREKAIICGDFRQLPPILATEQKAILDEIGSDVFHAAGIVSAVEMNRSLPRLVLLDEQYRMNDAICELISGFMYSGKLKTSAAVSGRIVENPKPLTSSLTIVDTSSLWPFETQTRLYSRYNLVHSLVVRNLIMKFKEDGYIKSAAAVGVCTPYSAQAKLVRRLIEDEGLNDSVEAGTVHHYQGDEKTTILIDIPESVGGGQFIGRFLQGDHPDDDSAKLLNVAASRACDHLVIIANLTYLDSRLPGNAFLRDMLFKMQGHQVIDASEILTLRAADLRGLGRPVDIDIETQRTGLFDQENFNAVFRADIEQAKASILVFSGFVTPERVGSYGDLFRQKILSGVKIRCVTRPPQYNGSIPFNRGKEALDALEGIGVIVDCRREVHQKVVIIDSKTVWFGSLNPLSHTVKTDETMMRVLSPGFAAELARQLSITNASSNDNSKHQNIVGENPRCPNCNHRTYYFRRRRDGRPFFACENADCNWLQYADAIRSNRNEQSEEERLPENGPPCPKCGTQMMPRRGRYGSFYACPRYPKCDGKMNVRQATEQMTSDR